MFRKSNVQHTLLFTQRMPLFGQRTPSTASLSHSQIFGPSHGETGVLYQEGEIWRNNSSTKVLKANQKLGHIPN